MTTMLAAICPWPHTGCSQVRTRGIANAWQVSSYGRVKSSRDLVSYGTLTAGYRQVCISKETFCVHRLVAAAFLGPPPAEGIWQVNHIDGDKGNNRANNLMYVTSSQNIRHSWAMNPRRAVKPGKTVLWRKQGEETWSRCASQADAARLLGVHRSQISKCCRGLLARSCDANKIMYEFKCAAMKAPQALAGEIWKPAEYPGQLWRAEDLMVSTYGRIFSATAGHSYLTYGTRTAGGYCSVQRRGRGLLVHRLVAATFLGQPETPDLQVNHKDACRGNNRLENLEYVTPSENKLHALGRTKQTARTCRKILASSIGHEDWTKFASVAAASEHTGISSGIISQVCHGLRSSMGDWNFKFAPQELDGEEWLPVVLEGARTPRQRRQ